jgi:hypothetical protein
MIDLNGSSVRKLSKAEKADLVAKIPSENDHSTVYAVIYDGGDISLCPLPLNDYQRGDYMWVYFLPYELRLLLEKES